MLWKSHFLQNDHRCQARVTLRVIIIIIIIIIIVIIIIIIIVIIIITIISNSHLFLPFQLQLPQGVIDTAVYHQSDQSNLKSLHPDVL